MTKDKNTYNYDQDIKNTLSNWNPDVPEFQIEQDWDKVNEIMPDTSASLPGAGESFIGSIKSNLAWWISGGAVLTTATLITYFILSPSNSETETLSDDFKSDKIENIDPAFDDPDIKDIKDKNSEQIPDHTSESDNFTTSGSEYGSVNKNKTTNNDKKDEAILIYKNDDFNPENQTATDDKPKDQTAKILTDQTILKDETKEKTSDIQIVRLNDSIVCFEQVKDRELFPQAGKYDIKYRITEDDKIKIIKRNLIVLPPLTASFEIYDINLPQLSFVNKSENASEYKWELAGETYYVKDPVITLSNSGDYNFTLYVSNEHECQNSYSLSYHYSNNQKLTVPNIFTPDGDGVNDEFVINISGEDYFHLSILNAEGKTVFQSRDKKHVWNGSNQINGEDCPNASYYYVLKYRFAGENEMHTKTGILTLIRKN